MNLLPKVCVILRNKEDQFFVHLKREDDRQFPKLFGFGVTGSVEPGELPVDAANRETLDQTKLESNVEFLFSIPYEDLGSQYMISVFEWKILDEEIPASSGAWKSYSWMSMKEVDHLLMENKFSPESAEVYMKYIRETGK